MFFMASVERCAIVRRSVCNRPPYDVRLSIARRPTLFQLNCYVFWDKDRVLFRCIGRQTQQYVAFFEGQLSVGYDDALATFHHHH